MHTAVPHGFTYGGETRCGHDLRAVDPRHRRATLHHNGAVGSVVIGLLAAVAAVTNGRFDLAAWGLLVGLAFAGWVLWSFRRGRLDGAGLTLASRTIPWEEVRGVKVVELRWPGSLLSSQLSYRSTEGAVNFQSSLAVVIDLGDRRLGLWMDSQRAADDLVARIRPYLGRVSGKPTDVPEALRRTMRDAADVGGEGA